MLTGSIPTFYRSRQVLLASLIAIPLLLLGGAWWLVNGFLLTPSVPSDASTAEECVRFMVDEKGLPRLDSDRRNAYIGWQTARLVQDAEFRERFITALRRSPPDEKRMFQENMILTTKPIIMADINGFHALETAKRGAFLDERIVAYNRLNIFFSQARLSKVDLTGALPTSPADLLAILMSHTTEEERAAGQAYLAALGERVAEINSDAALRKSFEQKIDEARP